MKVTIVPAQITTIEDRIAGNLSLSQLGLLLTPLFFGSVVYVLLPPFFSYSSYKVIIFATLLLLCATLAVRFRSQLVLTWLIKIGRYQLRPQIFVFTKNDLVGRATFKAKTKFIEDEPVIETYDEKPKTLPLPARYQVEQLLSGARRLSYKPTKKGGLHVVISKVSQEG